MEDLVHDALDVVIWRALHIEGLACKTLDDDVNVFRRLEYSPILGVT